MTEEEQRSQDMVDAMSYALWSFKKKETPTMADGKKSSSKYDIKMVYRVAHLDSSDLIDKVNQFLDEVQGSNLECRISLTQDDYTRFVKGVTERSLKKDPRYPVGRFDTGDENKSQVGIYVFWQECPIYEGWFSRIEGWVKENPMAHIDVDKESTSLTEELAKIQLQKNAEAVDTELRKEFSVGCKVDTHTCGICGRSFQGTDYDCSHRDPNKKPEHYSWRMSEAPYRQDGMRYTIVNRFGDLVAAFKNKEDCIEVMGTIADYEHVGYALDKACVPNMEGPAPLSFYGRVTSLLKSCETMRKTIMEKAENLSISDAQAKDLVDSLLRIDSLVRGGKEGDAVLLRNRREIVEDVKELIAENERLNNERSPRTAKEILHKIISDTRGWDTGSADRFALCVTKATEHQLSLDLIEGREGTGIQGPALVQGVRGVCTTVLGYIPIWDSEENKLKKVSELNVDESIRYEKSKELREEKRKKFEKIRKIGDLIHEAELSGLF